MSSGTASRLEPPRPTYHERTALINLLADNGLCVEDHTGNDRA
jgi:hypothetical protein